MRHSIKAATLLLNAPAGLSACFGGSDADEPDAREAAAESRAARSAESEAAEPRLGESDALERAIREIDLDALERMRDEGREAV